MQDISVNPGLSCCSAMCNKSFEAPVSEIPEGLSSPARCTRRRVINARMEFTCF